MRIFVAGHRGMVGSAIVRALERRGRDELLLRSRAELDLRDQGAVRRFMASERPDLVVLAAARVGGIHANESQPADFIADNLAIQTNTMIEAHAAGVTRLVFLGSTCIYPKLAPQPIPEEAMLTGLLEPTNAPYAIAKIAGIQTCEAFNRQHGTDYRALMPTNLYGPHDNFHAQDGHVVPALMRRFHEAKLAESPEVVVWGTGTPQRELLHVDDLAAAVTFVIDLPRERFVASLPARLCHLNVGSGDEVTIRELAELLTEIVGYRGALRFDANKPDGTPRKLADGSRLRGLGWRPTIALRDGLRETYRWWVDHAGSARV